MKLLNIFFVNNKQKKNYNNPREIKRYNIERERERDNIERDNPVFQVIIKRL
jgi:hypothetical protein